MRTSNPEEPESSTTTTNGKKAIQFLDLPAETIGIIFENASNHELAQLCRVSKFTRELAAAELYRDLNHTFRLDPHFREALNIDYLAGYLETLATSDYNYAGHIKEVYIDTAAAGEPGERSCREFTYDHTCGKFLNTLLLATLKRTRGLEGFYWNARIELSSSVYQTLYRMPNLRRVHIRLQPGPSLHSTSNYVPSLMNIPSPPVNMNVIPAPPGHPPAPIHSHNGFNPPQHFIQVQIAKKIPVAKQVTRPSTFSQFKELKSLSVLDMDTLEYVPEIAECIHNCSDSLRHLQLSMSDKLARKARRAAVAESVSDNTGSDDELSVIIEAPPMPFEIDIGSAGANTVLPQSNQSHKASQEHALARIFEYKPPTPQSQELKIVTDDVIARADKEMQLEYKTSTRDQEDRSYVRMIQKIFREEREKAEKGEIDRSSRPYRALDKIERAASKYLESREHTQSLRLATHKKGKKKVAALNKKLASKKAPPETFTPISSSFAHNAFIPTSPPPPMSNHTNNSASQEPVDYLEFDDFLYDEISGQKHMYPTHHEFGTPPDPPYDAMLSTQIGAFKKTKQISAPIISWDSNTIDELAPPEKAQIHIPAKHKKGKAKHYGKPVSGTPSPPALEEEQNGLGDEESREAAVEIAKPPALPEQDVFDDDIDMEHPDEVGEDGEDQKFVNEAQANGNENGADEEEDVGNDSTETVRPLNGVPEAVSHALEDSFPQSSETTVSKGKQAVRDPPAITIPPSKDLKSSSRSSTPDSEASESAATYLRLSHGIPLENLGIYLLPVKPSVLLRHVDVHSLKYLCLLNVGPQRTLWATLAKLHRQAPLQLNSIYTDNVTHSFLMFVNGLEEGQIEELFMLEHGPRADVPQLQGCGKTMVDMEEIRKMVLRKHMKGMKRLMIRNDDEDSWALNVATARLIAKQGSKLRELAVQCASVVYHSLMRSLPTLPNLYALQITFLLDTIAPPVPMTPIFPPPPTHHHHHQSFPGAANATMLYELRHCLIDNLSHCKDGFNLEYLGLSCVDGHAPNGQGLGPPLVILSKVCSLVETWSADESDEDDGGRDNPGEAAARKAASKGEVTIWTEDNLKMVEVQGLVRMWDKEVWAGRL